MQKEFLRNLPSLSLLPKDRVQTLITSPPSVSRVANVSDLLTSCYHDDFEFNTFQKFTSAISAYHKLTDGVFMGQHLRVSALFSGDFNLKPVQPRFTFTWGVKKIYQFLINFDYYNRCTLKDLA